MRERTAQEAFWEGEFGSEYTERNQPNVAGRQPFFDQILKLADGARSVCELGANRGHNLAAIGGLAQDLELTGVELNPAAVELLSKVPRTTAVRSSILDFDPGRQFDLTFTCGVLIHVNPDDLSATYRKLYELSSRYVLINEYWNPAPVALDYRGHGDRLFKRDFLGEFMDQCGGAVRVVGYGFLWRRLEPDWDDTTWALFEKTE